MLTAKEAKRLANEANNSLDDIFERIKKAAEKGEFRLELDSTGLTVDKKQALSELGYTWVFNPTNGKYNLHWGQ